ncbi:penicillin-binding protein activator [Xenorhabdus kozodoii]|uniref:Penicillin-binding protein activator LpoA n=1 Tax=Xenorhabdus kozodoii TaxID=351676 RepID=A0A2D0L6X7_9GAMM|nr:penicillin-binding protein activator [Xenorhabdus kozodoii]PHM69863.1 penicillin-binding protein activator LpoA [Xenorhabdus kozodoii]PHM71355.1 penicillin-binding protein activator LpoA [Xenorhabdus kozodoii]
MLPSIFVRFKTGLIYTALLSAMIIAGCTMPRQQGQPTSKPQDKISAEINRYQAIIDAAHNQPSLDVIRAYIALGSYATDDAARQKNIDETWQLLTQLSPQQMSELVINADEYTLQGWLDLLNTYQTNKQDLDKLRLAIRDWQIRYPDNPAARTLPTALQQETREGHATIGLFLPLSGQAKMFGDAIRQGFLDAQKGLPKPSLPKPSSPESSLPANVSAPSEAVDANPENISAANSGNADVATTEPQVDATTDTTSAVDEASTVASAINDAPVNDQAVKVYDTNSQPLTALLEQAKQEGVTLVVGPLLKPNVEQLAQIETPLNILALNELDMPQRRPNICYFSLSPEDEAKNAAMHIWQQQKRSPLILIPRNELGTRVANAFTQEWQKLGGLTVLQQTFGTPDEMRKSMNRGVGIRLSGTPVIATSPAAEPVDAVYIVATTNELAIIKPMIDMAISSRKKPALYASSRSNQAGSGPDFRLEMDGMEFSDIPLLTGVNVPLMQQAAKKFTHDYSLMRLYAMGIDAWSLANQFTQMQQEKGFSLNGASGELSMTDNCTILRQLPWMQFNHGRITLEKNHNSEKNNSTEDIDNAENTHNIENTNNPVRENNPNEVNNSL